MFCHNCGNKLLEEANFCQTCGKEITRIKVKESINKLNESTNNSLVIENGITYAGFWFRVVAGVIDMIISLIIYVPLALISDHVYSDFAAVLLIIVVLLGPWLYFSLMESSSHQATLGKKFMGIKVTDDVGHRIGFGRATGRYFGKKLSSILYIGYIMIAFTKKKQGLHDLMANSFVLKDEKVKWL
ncbi:RDD family protein [Gottfriedia acidiceleris]|uniref:RDD family protein n=1 Tax=Gottfriedia acidiceleris TaxID=371036 RepID=UPI00300066EE